MSTRLRLIILTFMAPIFLGCESLSSPQRDSSNFEFNKVRFHVNKAEFYLFVDSNYIEARKHFDSAFYYYDTVRPVIRELLEYSQCLLYLGDTIGAYRASLRSIFSGNVELTDQTWLVKQFPVDLQDSMEFWCPILTQEYLKGLPDIAGYCQVKCLEQRDQDLRNWFYDQCSGHMNDSVLETTDAMNLRKLKSITIEREIDPDCILLYHLYGPLDSLFNFFDSIRHQNVLRGLSDPNSYAQWVDRQMLFVRKNKFARYGQWIEIGDTILPDVEDPENIDLRRREIGLCSISDQAKLWHVKPPSNWSAIQK